MGFGAQLGADVTDFLIVLNTDDAVKAFTRGENLTLGGNLSVSAGPVGFGQEYSGSLYDRAALGRPVWNDGRKVGVKTPL